VLAVLIFAPSGFDQVELEALRGQQEKHEEQQQEQAQQQQARLAHVTRE